MFYCFLKLISEFAVLVSRNKSSYSRLFDLNFLYRYLKSQKSLKMINENLGIFFLRIIKRYYHFLYDSVCNDSKSYCPKQSDVLEGLVKYEKFIQKSSTFPTPVYIVGQSNSSEFLSGLRGFKKGFSLEAFPIYYWSSDFR